MESLDHRPSANSSPVVLAGAFCIIVGTALVLWFMSGFLFLGGAMLFGAIAGVLGYQRQCAILILAPLIVFAGLWMWFENETTKRINALTDELEKTVPGLKSPSLKKFD